jgi:UDP-glucuronate 4-epimerase
MYTERGEARPGSPIVVTGAAGFIGYHVTRRLLERGDRVIGVDNLNAYYDVTLKEARLAQLEPFENFTFVKADLADRAAVRDVFHSHRPSRVVHLAAQAGVRYSLVDPHAYTESNVTGFLNILEGARELPVEHLVYASSSSVYGANTRQPFSEHACAEHPISLYAATKKANELMAHVYAHLFAVPCTGLRFFTVYGPWGRPDMALFKFTDAILRGEPIVLYNHGNMTRDFTYVDDVVEGVVRVMDVPAVPDPQWNGDDPDPARSNAPYRIFNIGNHQPVQLADYIAALEGALGRKASVVLAPMQPGDVPSTYADTSDLRCATAFHPSTAVADGVRHFVHWYRQYYEC